MDNNSIIKLDKVDRKILFELDKNCRIPITQLSKKVKKSRQAVEYRINQLVKKELITGFKTSINPHKINNKIYKIYLKLKNTSNEKQKLFTFLRKSDKVYWIGECSGKWDLIFGIFAKEDYEFFNFKNQFISKFNSSIVEEEGGILIDVQQYPKRYFTNEFSSPVMFAGKMQNNKLDETDYLLLNQIAGNARASIVELAEKTKTTPAIIIHRLKKLEKQKIILQYRLEIDISKLGLELYKAIIKMDRYNSEDEKKFLNYISNKPNIQYLIRNIWQIELELVVKSSHEYYEFVEELKKEFPKMIRTIDPVLMIKDEWTTGFENLLKFKKQ